MCFAGSLASNILQNYRFTETLRFSRVLRGVRKKGRTKKRQEVNAKMSKIDLFLYQIQAEASIPPESSGSFPSSYITEAALTLLPYLATPGGQKKTSPPLLPQKNNLAHSSVPTFELVAGTILSTHRGLYDFILPPDTNSKSYLIATCLYTVL